MSDFASLSLIMSITLITAMQAIAVNPVMNTFPMSISSISPPPSLS